MKMISSRGLGVALLIGIGSQFCLQQAGSQQILTPPAPTSPRVNGPTIFGVRPGSPFLYIIPATGERPMTFAVESLPLGLKVDPVTGIISGVLNTAGETVVTLRATNAHGSATKRFRIEAGERIGLTPAMGWSSWNGIAHDISQERILRNAQAIVASGLKDHGFSYVNLDDCWQGARGGPFDAIQGNELFPDVGQLAADIHALGLKFGLYSSPWMTSYGGFPGGSSDSPDGKGSRTQAHTIGKYSFAINDAKQWAAWGVDYVKEDWNPSDIEHTREIYEALRTSGRDILLSLSNTALIKDGAEYGKYAQSWRTGPDILDVWDASDKSSHVGISEIGFNQDRWAPYAGPGGFPDPDMLVVGRVSYSKNIRQTRLSPDEQYTNISLWAMLSAPLIMGMDAERLDRFTISLLANDEVLDIDQDALGKPAMRAATIGGIDVYRKELEDGSSAVGFFNRSDKEETYDFNKVNWIGLPGPQHVRDLWRQVDLPDVTDGVLHITVPAHGVLLYRMTSTR